jgi:hypothetical protein
MSSHNTRNGAKVNGHNGVPHIIGHNGGPYLDAERQQRDPLAGKTAKQIFQMCVWASEEPTATKLFLLCVARFFDADGRSSSMSYRQVAANCTLDERTAKAIARKVAGRWIVVDVGKGFKTAFGRQNLYHAIIPSDVVAAVRNGPRVDGEIDGVASDHPIGGTGWCQITPSSGYGVASDHPWGGGGAVTGWRETTLTIDNQDKNNNSEVIGDAVASSGAVAPSPTIEEQIASSAEDLAQHHEVLVGEITDAEPVDDAERFEAKPKAKHVNGSGAKRSNKADAESQIKRTRIDPHLPLDDRYMAAARKYGFSDEDAAALFAEFKSYWVGCGKPMANWFATWCNRLIMKSNQRNSRIGYAAKRSTADIAAEAARQFAESKDDDWLK